MEARWMLAKDRCMSEPWGVCMARRSGVAKSSHRSMYEIYGPCPRMSLSTSGAPDTHLWRLASYHPAIRALHRRSPAFAAPSRGCAPCRHCMRVSMGFRRPREFGILPRRDDGRPPWPMCGTRPIVFAALDRCPLLCPVLVGDVPVLDLRLHIKQSRYCDLRYPFPSVRAQSLCS